MAVEGFLGRWSRRKREAEREPASETPQEPVARTADVLQQPAAGEVAGGASAIEVDRVAVPDAGSRGRTPGGGAAGEDAGAPAGSAATGTDDAAGRSPHQVPAAGEARGASLADALPDIATLTGDSDFSPFMRAGVDPQLRVAALKKLFTDPRFNRMDGLDVYIDDYGKPDPLPPGMLRRLEQGRSMGLFRGEDDADQVVAADAAATGETPSAEPAVEPVAAPDEAAGLPSTEKDEAVAAMDDTSGAGQPATRGQLADRAGNTGNTENTENNENTERPPIGEGSRIAERTGDFTSGEPDQRGLA